jgi:GTP-binding protein
VGKSTLINRVLGKNELVVDEIAGVTRDRKHITAQWRGIDFEIIDTGGLDTQVDSEIKRKVHKHALDAAKVADVILFMVDGRETNNPDDDWLSHQIKKLKKYVIMVANKCDDPARSYDTFDFMRFGFGPAINVSSLHGIGIGDLLDEIMTRIPHKIDEKMEEEVSICIVGRQNVGKSSILNAILGEERVIVDEKPGTTRDTVDTYLLFDERMIRLIDTAGIRGKLLGYDSPDYFSVVRSYRSMDSSDVAIIVFDATSMISHRDIAICHDVLGRGCGALIALNKWDELSSAAKREIEEDIMAKLHDLSFIPVVRTSAKTNRGIDALLKTALLVNSEKSKRISTKDLNEFLLNLKNELGVFSKDFDLKFITQIDKPNPAFVLFINYCEIVSRKMFKQFRRFIINKLREKFRIEAVPISLIIRRSKD